MILWNLPYLLVGFLMTIDEGHYHRRRGLPKWELIGHPLDTLTVLITLGISAFTPYSALSFWVFVVAAIFSSLFVTKDEFIHNEVCPPGEQWVHALLFILHPCVFFGAYQLWTNGEQSFIQIQFGLTFLFWLYQLREAYYGIRKAKV